MEFRSRILVVAIAAVFSAGACHRSAGTHPDDMSAAKHDDAAAKAEAQAVEHEVQYDPNPTLFDGSDCSEFCFQSNSTEHHLRQADRLRREAARHRDASHDLRVAEARACAQIPELHRDFSPFYHRGDITGVEASERGPIVVHFGEIPKTSAAGLQRLVDCHLARNAAMGFDTDEMAEMDYCPLGVAGVTASVVETATGFDILLDVDDEQARPLVSARVKALLEPE